MAEVVTVNVNSDAADAKLDAIAERIASVAEKLASRLPRANVVVNCAPGYEAMSPKELAEHIAKRIG